MVFKVLIFDYTWYIVKYLLFNFFSQREFKRSETFEQV
jgi:hypothetical protein